MKKKCLKLFLIVLLLVILFTLTGCGNKESSTNKVEEIQNISDTNSVSNSTSNVESSEINDDGTKISAVLQAQEVDTDGAVVKLSDNTVNVINDKGEIIRTISDKYGFEYNLRSYIYKNGLLYSEKEVIDLDNDKKIVEATDKLSIKGVTSNGYILTVNTIENLSGKTYELKVADKVGNTLWREEDEKAPRCFSAVGKDFIVYSEGPLGSYNFIDVNTGKTTDLEISCDPSYFVCERQGDYLLVGIDSDEYYVVNTNTGDVINTGLRNVHKILNDKYVYATPLWGTVGIYTMQGELVKDLSEGEVKEINYKDNTYSVISKTDFYYTLNDNFEYIVQPVKINESFTNFYFRPYGIRFNQGADNYYIKDSDFKADQPLSDLAVKIGSGDIKPYEHENVSTLFYMKKDPTTGMFTTDLVDAKTLEIIEIKKGGKNVL